MKVHTAARRGIPLKTLVIRILAPAAFVLLTGAALLSYLSYRQIERGLLQDVFSTVNTVYDTHPAIHGQTNGLAVLRRTRGFERFWILSATGDILASSRDQDIGNRLDRAWWKYLEGHSGGTFYEVVPFGSRSLLMVGVYHPDQGRWAVLVTDQPGVVESGIGTLLIILALSLILAVVTGVLSWYVLRRQIDRPVQYLDDAATDLLRGTVVSDSTLERVRAETEPFLGGHADVVIDLARKLLHLSRRNREVEDRFDRLFDALDGFAFIRSSDSRILGINATLHQRVGLSREWTLGNTIHILRHLVPVRVVEEWLSRSTSKKIAVRNVEVTPEQSPGLQTKVSFSAIPMRFKGDTAHLIIVKEAAVEAVDPIAYDTAGTDSVAADEANSEDRAAEKKNDREVAVEHEGTGPVEREAVMESERRTSERTPAEPGTECSGDGALVDVRPEPTKGKQELLRAILDAGDEIVTVLDETAKVVLWNDTATTLTGWSPSDIPTLRTFGEVLFDDDSRSRFQSWLSDTPTKKVFRISIKTKKGKQLETRWRAKDIKTLDGSTYGVLTGKIVRSVGKSRKRTSDSQVRKS